MTNEVKRRQLSAEITHRTIARGTIRAALDDGENVGLGDGSKAIVVMTSLKGTRPDRIFAIGKIFRSWREVA